MLHSRADRHRSVARRAVETHHPHGARRTMLAAAERTRDQSSAQHRAVRSQPKPAIKSLDRDRLAIA